LDVAVAVAIAIAIAVVAVQNRDIGIFDVATIHDL
jgi:hypothetical protein